MVSWCVTLVALGVLQAVLAQEYRLPGDVVPRHYDLRLLYDIDPASNFSFYGVADILVTAKKQTSRIVLHAQDFRLSDDKITLIGINPIAVTDVSLNDTYNLLTLTLEQTLEEGQNYTLTIPFYGNLTSGLKGVYISNYVDKNTQNKEYLITTQFEAISARKGFPCFDEPLYKATFRINLGHHKVYSAVSNMPLLATSPQSSMKEYWPWEMVESVFKKDKQEFVWDQFENSVPMSTYLVAFVISKFAYLESPTGLSTTKFKIWARKDAVDQALYASTVGPKVLSYYEKWFNVSFPLPKQDMFAIPDFAAGAMENWGLITYRETALLYDPRQSSFLNKERVAEVIAHELAHQWFGNLVTMKWWQDLWLNEGFATYMATLGVEAAEPTWAAGESAIVDDILNVLALDALQSSHPVSVPIEDPKRISEIFDQISYRKGSILIRMMIMFLGEDVFRDGINKYLVKYSYNNAEQDDLWHELDAARRSRSHLRQDLVVKDVMDTWTTQTGYPLLMVNRDYSGTSLTVTQKRFLALGNGESSGASWWVPLGVLCEGESNPRGSEWLRAEEGTDVEHQLEHGANSSQWVLFNHNYMAPYRVNYDARNWELLTQALLGRKSVPTLSRVQLLNDAFALAWAGLLDYSTTLKLVSYLQYETEFLPIDTALTELSKIETVLKRSADYGAFQKFVRKLITQAYFHSGGLATKKIINGTDLISVKMQVTLSNWACRMNVPQCEENAIAMYQEWMDTENPDQNNPIPLDLRSIVYCVALRRGSVREWRFLLERMRNANVAVARVVAQQSLACSRDIWILAQFLEWTVVEDSPVRKQDAGSVLTAVARGPVGFYVVKNFVYTRIQDIYRHAFSGQGSRMGSILNSLLSQFTTQREVDEFVEWRKMNKDVLEESKLSIEQGLERARVNIRWLRDNGKHVVDKLRDIAA